MTRLSFAADNVEGFLLDLRRHRDRVEDAEPAFQAMMRYQVGVNRDEFAAQGGARTGKWEALSPKYGKWKSKARPGRPILVFDGDLRDSMTSDRAGIRETWNRGMTVGTGVSYAAYHQNGGGSLPVRRLIGESTREDQKQFAKILNHFIMEGVA